MNYTYEKIFLRILFLFFVSFIGQVNHITSMVYAFTMIFIVIVFRNPFFKLYWTL